jgi:predicted CoA-binding protein
LPFLFQDGECACRRHVPGIGTLSASIQEHKATGSIRWDFGSVNHDAYDDALIRRILREVKTVALVGASANEARPSWIVTKYLLDRGYDVIPVNPGLAGQTLLGKTVYGSLKDIPQPVDMVEIFRNSEAAGPITDEALALNPLPKVIWMQLSVRNDEAAA